MSGGVEADTRSRRGAGVRGAVGGPCESSVTRMGQAGVASGPLT
jgi:hypothetical protein